MPKARFTLSQIEHFLALAEELNFTRAAQRCRIAQPPFSRSIQRLEELVQAPLVTRQPRGAVLTESGRAFAERARAGLAALHDAVRQARLARPAARRLQIGLLEYAFAALGPRFIDEFARAHAGLLVEPLDMTPERLAFALRSGAPDVQFAAFPEQMRLAARAGLRELPVMVEPMAVLVDGTHAMARRRSVTLVEASGQRLIVFERARAPELYRATLQAFADLDVRPRVEFEVGLLQTMISAVRATGGVGLVPACVKAIRPKGMRVVPIEPSQAPRLRLSLVWSAQRESPDVLAFVDWVRRHRPHSALGPRANRLD